MPGCVLRVTGTAPTIPRELLIEGTRHRLSYSVSYSEHFAQQVQDAIGFLSKYASLLYSNPSDGPARHCELDFGVFASVPEFNAQFSFPPELVQLASRAQITIKLSAYFGSD
jgi:hypothetical protein